MVKLLDYDVYIFDCDGVILDSNNLKTNAFRKVLIGEPEERINELVKYHQENGGISRYEKFRHFYTHIKPHQNSEMQIKLALRRFGSTVSKELLECNYIPGVINYIRQINQNGSSCFINSGSDEKELKEVFLKRDILNLFKKIFGSPSTKNDNNKRIIELIGSNKKCVVFGDSASDYFSAKEFNLDFVFVSGVSEWKNYSGEFLAEIKDFRSLIHQ